MDYVIEMLNIVKEFHVLAEQKLHLEVVLFLSLLGEGQLVVFKILTCIRANNFNVGLYREELHEVLNFLRNITFRQNRDIGWLN